MNKPFIKLIRSPNSGYFYDVGKNEVLRISDDTYRYLNAMLSDVDVQYTEETIETVECLKKLGYLSSARPITIQHPSTELAPTMLNRAIDKLTLQLTQDCNFRCKYCIYSEETNLKQRSHSNRAMSIETATKAIRFYREHSIDSPSYNIGLYGGEPLLQWNLAKEIIELSERELIGKPLTFTITTNASLLTDSIASFLEYHNVSVLISLDGIKLANDKNRRFVGGEGTYDLVINNIRNIKKNHPKLFESIRISSVIDPKIDITCFGKYPEELSSLPASSFSIGLVENTDYPILISAEFQKAVEAEYLLAYLNEFYQLGLTVSPFGQNQVQSVKSAWEAMKPAPGMPDITAPSGPCIPGKGRLFVTVDGKMYPCEKVNETEAYCIGELDGKFNWDTVSKLLNIGQITADSCMNCWAFRQCNICAKRFDHTGKDAAEEKLHLCDSVRRMANENIRAMILLYEMDIYYGNLKPWRL